MMTANLLPAPPPNIDDDGQADGDDDPRKTTRWDVAASMLMMIGSFAPLLA
jgi:hypothetical protein